MPEKFTYKFTGSSPKRLRGQVVKPGDVIDTDDEIINGEFEPQNAAAKSAQKATEAADAARAELHAKERQAAAQGLPLEEAFPELAKAAEPTVSTGKKSAAAAPAAQQEA
jgi:hypothetical protein